MVVAFSGARAGTACGLYEGFGRPAAAAAGASGLGPGRKSPPPDQPPARCPENPFGKPSFAQRPVCSRGFRESACGGVKFNPIKGSFRTSAPHGKCRTLPEAPDQSRASSAGSNVGGPKIEWLRMSLSNPLLSAWRAGHLFPFGGVVRPVVFCAAVQWGGGRSAVAQHPAHRASRKAPSSPRPSHGLAAPAQQP